MKAVRFAVDDVTKWRWQALQYALTQQGGTDSFIALFNNNGIQYPNDPFPNRLCIGAKRVGSFTDDDAFQTLHESHRRHPSYLVGYFGYDLKNQIEVLQSRNPDRLGFPDVFFAEPEWIIDLGDVEVLIQGEGDAQALFDAVVLTPVPAALPTDKTHSSFTPTNHIQCRVTPEEYQANVRQIQQYIEDGDVYELNYCIEFFVNDANLDPLAIYQALTERSPMPFSTFMKIGSRYLMGASPERFLKKQGQTLISQPIKGTIRRGQTQEDDQRLREQLLSSEKERAENLMIVDLVRNDLARSAETGSVRVDELFGIYTFQQVHQMISTVSATLRENTSWAEAIKNAFPMGSMTGAPKIRAMELIDELEVSRRGLFSGAIGFITPDADFDFNVVIRSLQYNADSQYTSFSVGSAITYDADPAQEWEECLLKAQAIRNVLETVITG